MGQWKHRLTDVDPVDRTAVCLHCGPTSIKSNGHGTWRCTGARKLYRAAKGPHCERCGFVAQHVQQLDVHHRDGDHQNDSLDNLETLCANCHRLEHAPRHGRL